LAGETLEFDAALSQRDFLHVDDVGSALATLAKSEVQGPVNVASGAPTSVRHVVETLSRLMHKDDSVIFSNADGVADAVVADVTRLRDKVGWRPLQTFEERLQATCYWWQSHYR
jgi:nucleoside-diphosphate-sugar epimerase